MDCKHRPCPADNVQATSGVDFPDRFLPTQALYVVYIYQSIDVIQQHKGSVKAFKPLTWHVHISQIESANGMRLQQRLACTNVECAYLATDVSQRHATSAKHACTDMACVHLTSDVCQQHAWSTKACTHHLCRVHIYLAISAVLWMH